MQALLLEFGEFSLDIPNARLNQTQSSIALTPKAFAVLHYLAESGGQLVSKDELLDTVWAGRVVGDAALQVCVGEIRKALRDDRRNPKYIETVPKRGYRFIADVTHSGDLARSTSTHAADVPPSLVVGRDEALARLQHYLDGALQSRRQVVFISGEPGIGKTTLSKVFLERAAERYGCLTSSGQCIDHRGTAEAYLPVLDALGHLCRSPDGAEIIVLLRRHAPLWLTQMPALLSEDERETLQRQLINSSQERMLREMVEALEAIAADKPLVVLFEDLQWSDHATLDLLAYLIRRTQPARLLVLGTYRPVDVIVTDHAFKGLKQELSSHENLAEIPLELVGQEDITAYLNGRFPGISDERKDTLARMVYRQTDGNPLFMVNVFERLKERGWLVNDGDSWHLQDDFSEGNIGVPESLKELLDHQLQRTSDEQLSILETASVAGVEFTSGELAAGLNRDNAADEEACEQLAQNGQFIRPSGLDEWPDGTLNARYQFGHALYREILYERLAPLRRVQIHQRIGTRLEKAYGKQVREYAAQLAIHFEQARQNEKAVLYLRQAAETALQRHAHIEAVTYLTKALKLLVKRPSTSSSTENELKIVIALGAALLAVKGYAAPEVEETYLRAQELCMRIGKSPVLVHALAGLGAYYLFSGKLPQALKLGEQILGAVEREKHSAFLANAYVGNAVVHYYMGDFARARGNFERGISVYNQLPKEELRLANIQDADVVSMSMMATLLWILGYPDRARDHSRKALALAERQSDPFDKVTALFWAARLNLFLGEHQIAQKQARQASLLSNEKQFAFWGGGADMFYGAALINQGQIQPGIEKLQKGLIDWQAAGTQLALPYFLALQADAYCRIDRLNDALSLIERAIAIAQRHQERWWDAELYRHKGEILAKQGAKMPDVERCFQKAIETARCQQAKSLELRAVMGLCRLWRDRGKAKKAKAMLQEIYEWYTEGFDTQGLKSVASLLRTLDDKPG